MTDEIEIGSTLKSSLNEHAARDAVLELRTRQAPITYTYTNLRQFADKIAAQFDQGSEPGSPLGLFLQRSVVHIATILAALASNRPFFSLNPKLGIRHVANAVDNTNASLLVVDNSCLIRLSGRDSHKPLAPNVLHFSDGETKSFHRDILGNLHVEETVRTMPIEEIDGPLSRNDYTAKYGPDEALFLFTSGSTGTPKCVPVLRADLLERVQGEIDAYELTPNDRLLSILPFSFDVGCNQLFSSLVAGCTLVLQNSWLPSDIIDSIEKHKITGISGVPSIWESLLQYNVAETTRALSRLRFITISGGDLPVSALDRLREIAPNLAIIKTYGQTETFRTTLLPPELYDYKRLSVGRPFAGAEFFIIRPDGSEADIGEVGEVIHQGVGAMRGYLGKNGLSSEGKVRAHPLGHADDGPPVIYTGDRGKIDDEGFLYLCGRMDRMFKVRGNRVYPEEIEKALLDIEGISSAAAAMLAKENQSILCAAVTGTGPRIDVAIVRSKLLRSLPAYMVPEDIRVFEDLPRTPSGKVNFEMTEKLLMQHVFLETINGTRL